MNGPTLAQTPKIASLPPVPLQTGLLQRKCACGGSPGVDGECAECRAKSLSLQRSATNKTGPSIVPPLVHDVLRSSGRPLDAGTRAFMEPRFGHDFSQVRVHTDARATESAQAVNALAYTVGRDVVFEKGQYAPGTSVGQRLMAHELTHVVQQSSGMDTVQRNLKVNDVKDADEQEAERISASVVGGGSVHPLKIMSHPTATLQRLENSCPDDPTAPHKLLRQHMVDVAVGQVQRKLNQFHKNETDVGRPGLMNAPLEVDCNFGTKTFNAVYSFQLQRFPGQSKEHDGKVGDHTWAELDKALVTPPTPPSTESRKVPKTVDVTTKNQGQVDKNTTVKKPQIEYKPKEQQTITSQSSQQPDPKKDVEPLFQFTAQVAGQNVWRLTGFESPKEPCDYGVIQIGGKWNWRGVPIGKKLSLFSEPELDINLVPAFCGKLPGITLQDNLLKWEIMKKIWELSLQGVFGLQDDWLKNWGDKPLTGQVGPLLEWQPWGDKDNSWYSNIKFSLNPFVIWNHQPEGKQDFWGVGGQIGVGIELP